MSFTRNSFFIKYLEKILPEMKSQKNKYSNGMCGMIGSSKEYTGGIYFSAYTAMKVGADQSHIFAHSNSVIPLKCYSPELIVHDSFSSKNEISQLKNESRWLKNFNTLLYGVCMSKDNYVIELLDTFLYETSQYKNIIHIFDADALHFFNNTELFSKYIKYLNNNLCIFTPNRVEFNRMLKEIIAPNTKSGVTNFNHKEIKHSISSNKLEDEEYYNNLYENIDSEEDIIYFSNTSSNDFLYKEVYEREKLVSTLFDNKIIFKKGVIDIITNGNEVILVKNKGNLKRCGGIGDILGGILSGFFSMWLNKNNITLDTFKKYKKGENEVDVNMFNTDMSNEAICVCALASFYCREISRIAYEKHDISLTSSDILKEIINFPISKIK